MAMEYEGQPVEPRNMMAKELWTPKYRMKMVPAKKGSKSSRKSQPHPRRSILETAVLSVAETTGDIEDDYYPSKEGQFSCRC